MDSQAPNENATRKTNEPASPDAFAIAGAQVENLSQRLPRSLSGGVALLTVVMAVALGVIGSVGYSLHGTPGLLSTASAAFVCWAASAAALYVSHLFAGTPAALTGLLLSIGLRTGVPLIGGVLLSSQSRMLADAGVLGFFVIFYLLSLATETMLSVGLINSQKNVEKTT